MQEYTPEQQATLDELDVEIRQLEAEADEKFGQYRKLFKDGDRVTARSVLDEVMAMDEEARLKKLIGYVPSSGEGKVAKVKEMLAKLGRNGGKKGKPDSWQRQVLEGRLKTLEFVNDFRSEMGLPPLDRLPVGVTGDAQECTIAKAITMGMDAAAVNVSGIGDIEVASGAESFEPTWEVTRQDVEDRVTEEDVQEEFYQWVEDRVPTPASDEDLVRMADLFFEWRGADAMSQWKYWFVGNTITNFDHGEYMDLAQHDGGSYLEVMELILRERPDALDMYRKENWLPDNWVPTNSSGIKSFIAWAENNAMVG